ncbi:DUF1398 domain-containing protein [soil metagenome]
MSGAAIENLRAAREFAAAVRPTTGGFPYLAEAMSRAGVHRNEWHLPSMQSLYLTNLGPVVEQGTPLESGLCDVARFDTAALIQALRADQAGRTSFLEFTTAAWRAGVVRYVVDLDRRTCTYYGVDGESFVETYPGVSLPDAVPGTR